MQDREGEPGARVVGRERELAVLDAFLAGDDARTALVLVGGPGIGKTTLWESGIAAARRRGLRVLAARPSEAETQLSLAAIADLLDEVGRDALAGLPAPQLHALEVALLRTEVTGPAPAPRAVALGFLNALRALAGADSLLVAVDDEQWLDTASADALAFALRRLEGVPVRFLLARRPRGASVLERALGTARVERLEVGPLSLGAIRRLLSERLELPLPRRVLQRTFETAQGNPLFAIELGRMVLERGLPEIGDELAAPEELEELLGARVARLAGPVRRVLLALALSADLRTSQLAAIADVRAVDDAHDAGLLVVERDRVRPAHPMLSAAVWRQSGAGERREMHLALAGAVATERRARHLALTAERPDDDLAATIGNAAARAAARGAAEEAVELAGHALRLTPPGSPARIERLLALGGYLAVAGGDVRLAELLEPEVDSLPDGASRARAHLLLADGEAVQSRADYERHIDRAFVHSAGDPGLRAKVLAARITATAVAAVEEIAAAEGWALEALPAARAADSEAERGLLFALAWVRVLRGRPVDDLVARFHAASDAVAYLYRSPERPAAVRLGWRGEITAARGALTRLLTLADERGEALSYVSIRLHLCELELRAGAWDAASRLLDEWEQSGDGALVGPLYERARALVAAGRGEPEEAQRLAAGVITGAEATGIEWERLEGLRARGLAALLAGDPGLAAESLRAVWEHTQRVGVEDPAVFPVAPDLVEGLAEQGELEEAAVVAGRLRELAAAQEHPWARTTAIRCDALAQLASRGDPDEALTALTQAAAAYEARGLAFDHARTLLLRGRAERRLKRWGAARATLERTASAFDAVGSPGWADQARSELARVGARRPSPAGELTATELRVAELAASGLANKQIAQTLFVTVHTVEVHLSHAYAKLGIRSRTQLARHLPARGETE